MAVPLPLRPLLPLLSRALSDLVRSDPDSRPVLDALAGKRIRLELHSPSLSVDLAFEDRELRITAPAEAQQPDVVFRGEVHALRSLLAGNEAIYRGEVVVEGDIGVAENLKRLVAGLDPDWPSALSPFLGDALVHRLERLFAQGRAWGRQSREHLALDTRDYLQEESALLVPPLLARERGEAIDELIAAVDRLEARVRRLEGRDRTRNHDDRDAAST